VLDAARQTNEHFAIVPVSDDIAAVETRFAARSGGTALLIYRLHALGRDCHLVIDTAPGNTTFLGRAAIVAADVVIVPVRPLPGADRDAIAVVNQLRGMAGTAHVFVVAVQSDGTGDDVALLEDGLRQSHLAVTESFPHENAIARCAALIGSPLALAPESQCAASYRSLAHKIKAVIAERRGFALLMHAQPPA
jgi:cellulose biosynthesis protein BcsQ